MTLTISATDLKYKISEIINSVSYAGNTAIIERHGKPVARIIPYKDTAPEPVAKPKAADFFGALPDFPEANISTLRGSIKGKLVSEKKRVKRIKRKINPTLELLKLAKEAEEIDRKYGKSTGPTDWSINHDYYLYGTPKKKP